MRNVVTGLVVQVEVTQYSDDNKKAGNIIGKDGKPLGFAVSEADIPELVLEWVRAQIGLKPAGDAGGN